MNKKYFYKYAISKQQQIQKESNHLFQVALLFFFFIIRFGYFINIYSSAPTSG